MKNKSASARRISWLLLFATCPVIAMLIALLGLSIQFLWENSEWQNISLSNSAILPLLAPIGAPIVAIFALVLDSSVRGYQVSALKRIWDGSPSADADLFYTFLFTSNLKSFLGFVFACGSAHFFHYYILKNFSLSLLTKVPFPLALFILIFVQSFVFYWVHRTMHSQLFWPLHRVHHSAAELNLITNFRNHPLNITVELFFYSVTTALLGGSFALVISYAILNGFYQLFAHSEGTWNLRNKKLGFIQDWILLAPEEHRIHHSQNPSHWNKNFGLTPLWDKVFHTWMEFQPHQKILVGLNDEKNQNKFSGFKGMFSITIQFYIHAKELLYLTFKKKVSTT